MVRPSEECIGKLRAAEADVALQSTLWYTARKKIDTHTPEMARLRKKLFSNDAELSRLTAMHSELSEGLSRVKSQNATGAIVRVVLKLVARSCEISKTCDGDASVQRAVYCAFCGAVPCPAVGTEKLQEFL